MHTVTFIVALFFSLVAVIIAGVALGRMSKNDARARGTLAAGFGFWLSGIVLAAVLFIFFSL